MVPRYGKLRSKTSGEVIGFENIELISDRPIDVWLDEFRQIKKDYPKHMLIASIMEEYEKGALAGTHAHGAGHRRRRVRVKLLPALTA